MLETIASKAFWLRQALPFPAGLSVAVIRLHKRKGHQLQKALDALQKEMETQRIQSRRGDLGIVLLACRSQVCAQCQPGSHYSYIFFAAQGCAVRL